MGREAILQHPRLRELVDAWCAEAQYLSDSVASGRIQSDQLPRHLAVFEGCIDDLQTEDPSPDYPAASASRLRDIITTLKERII